LDEEDCRTATSVGNDEIHRQVFAVHRLVDESQHRGRCAVDEQFEVIAVEEG
jgi:hypothetical protein